MNIILLYVIIIIFAAGELIIFTNASNIVEIKMIPRNPDGQIITTPTYNVNPVIYDLDNYWPHINSLTMQNISQSIMIFSLAKLTGHSTGNFGWALINDSGIAQSMSTFIQQNPPSSEAQYRALKLLTYMGNTANGFMSSVKYSLHSHWVDLRNLINSSTKYNLTSSSETQYAWISCNPNNSNCSTSTSLSFLNSGSLYGNPTYVRVNLLMSNQTFANFKNTFGKTLN